MPKKITFAQAVYQALLQVPKGRVTTYQALAKALHCRAYQAVGQALSRNPDTPRIPCHRVVTSNGRIGGFAGQRTGSKIKKKIRMLKNEGLIITQNEIKNFPAVFFQPR